MVVWARVGSRNVFGHYEGVDRHYFRFYSGSTKVLPGPPKYLLHRCPYGARPVPEIVPKIVPDPPLRAQSFLLLGRRISLFFSRNVFAHDEGVDRNYLRLLFGLYQGSPKHLPHQCSCAPCVVPKSFLLLERRISMFVSRNVFGH